MSHTIGRLATPTAHDGYSPRTEYGQTRTHFILVSRMEPPDCLSGVRFPAWYSTIGLGNTRFPSSRVPVCLSVFEETSEVFKSTLTRRQVSYR